MKQRKRIRRGIEALAALVGLLVIPILPRRAVVALARAGGAMAWRCAPGLRAISDANLQLAFGEALPAGRRWQIGRASFQNFTLTMLDLFWFRLRTEQRLTRYFRMEEAFRPIVEKPPVIGVTGHIGNWEVVSLFCGLRGAPLTAVAMPLENKAVDRILNRLRQGTGSVAVARQGAVRALLKSLKAGRTIALVLDQNTRPEEGGIFMPFFGLPVPVSKAAGLLWQRTGLPLMTVVCVADAKGVYTATALPPYPEAVANGGEKPEAEAVTRQALDSLEQLIRRYPEFWVWSYKRWRYYRAEDPAERYPFYAKAYVPRGRG